MRRLLLFVLLAQAADDPLPPRAVARLGTLTMRVSDTVQRIAFTPDGKGICLGGTGDAGVWNLADGKAVARRRTMYNAWHVGIAFGNIPVALSDNGGEVQLLNLSTGKEIQLFKNRRGWHGAALSADGALVAAVHQTGSPIVLFDTVEGKQIREIAGHSKSISDLKFSRDGKWLGTVSFENSVRIWDVATGELRADFPGHGEKRACLAFAGDGKTLASGGYDEKIMLWDVAAARPLGEPLAVGADVVSLAFSPDGRSIAGIVTGSVRVWDVATRKELLRIARSTGQGAVAFAPDGKTLAASVRSGVSFWELPSGKEIPAGSGSRGAIWSVSWSSDGASLATAGEDLVVWDAAGRSERFRSERRSERAAFSPDGRTIAVGGYRTLRLLDARDGKEIRKIEAHAAQITALRWAPDGKKLASGSPDDTIKIWDPESGRELQRLAQRWPLCVAFSPDGTLLAGGNSDGSAALWSAADGKLLRPLGKPGGRVMDLAFSPDGKQIALGTNTAQIVDVESGQVVQNLPGPKAAVSALAWTSDGKFLAGSPLDNRIRFWELSSGRQLHFVDGHDIQINALAFSPDGRFLASGSHDTTVLIWDLGFLKE